MPVMRTTTLLLVLVAALGCSKKAKTTPTPPDPGPTTTAKKTDKPVREVSADTLLSPGIAVSPDIAKACGLKATTKAGSAPTFDYDKDELLPEDRAVLEQIATCLTSGALKGKQVELVGRADPRGTEEYNIGLGSRRANTVSSFLGKLGVGQPQLLSTSRGALEATGTDEEGWKKDRRVDILLAQPKG
jgi:peptidoglycan-associated lipoprotein